MLRSVFAKGLRDSRRGFMWWSAGIIAFVALITAVWPSVRDNPALVKLHETYPETLKAFVGFGGEFDFGTPAGYLGAELFSFMVPLLLLVAAIGGGARTIAGEEENGTLDLLLSHPVSRHRVALEKLGALCLELVTLGAIFWLALWIGTRAAGMRISGAHLLAAVTSTVLLALAFGALATLAGAATGRRTWAIALPSALAVTAYLVNALAPLVHALDGVRKASPWYHYAASDPLRHGLATGHALVLFAVFLIAAVLVPIVFECRDLSA